MELRFGTYNLLNYEGPATAGERYDKVVEVIRGLDVDVLAVQEVLAPDEQTAGKVLAELGEDVGMTCWWAPGQPAVALGHKLSACDVYFNVGLLWKPEMQPIPGKLRLFSEDFWHSLAIGVFDLDGVHVAMASHHATPFGRSRRADECERAVSVLTRPDTRPPGLLAGDMNTIGADRTETGEYYDSDWYAAQEWYDDLVYQCRWDYDERGVRRHWADREPGEVLYAGGLRDAAACLGGRPEPTVGHWPSDDPFGERRIDTVRVTREVVPALRSIETVRTALTLAASDHLPVVVTFDTDQIAAR